MLKHFDTSSTPPPDRFAYWHEEVCRQIYTSETLPGRADGFRARMWMNSIGSLKISEIQCEPLISERKVANLRLSPGDDFYVSLLRSGVGYLEQSGRLSVQKPGDMVLYEAAKPFTYRLPDPFSLTLVKIPRQAMFARLHRADRMTSVTIASETGLGSFAATTVRAALQVETDDSLTQAKVAASVIDIVAAVFDERLADETATDHPNLVAFERAKRFMRANIDDSDLDVEKIAKACRTSASTLARAFASTGTTVMRWLWEERLLASRSLLMEGRTNRVTDVALICGFSNFSHFSRRFKARFGNAPKTLISNRKR